MWNKQNGKYGKDTIVTQKICACTTLKVMALDILGSVTLTQVSYFDFNWVSL